MFAGGRFGDNGLFGKWTVKISLPATFPAMAVAIPRVAPFLLRWQGLRMGPQVGIWTLVCGQCQRQKERRKFHSSTMLRKKDNEKVDNNRRPSKVSRLRTGADDSGKEEYQFSIDGLEDKERADYESLSPSDQEVFRGDRKRIHDILNSPEVVAEFQSMTAQTIADSERDAPLVERPYRPRYKPGFWNMGEVEKEDSGNDEVFEGDDLNELGHAELEQHREMREYARIAAWEMPLLSST